MEKSNIDASIKEAVIAEVKKLTGYSGGSYPHQYRDGDFSVKYAHERSIDIYHLTIGISFKPDTDADDLIWRKAADMLKIAVEVPDPRRTEVFNHLYVLAQKYLDWHHLFRKVQDGNGFDKFWKTIKDTYGEHIPSNELSDLIELRGESEKGLTLREYLELIADEIVAQSPNPPKKEAPEYVPPIPPVNPIEQALAEIAELRTRVEVIEHVKDVEIKALRDRLSETELDSKTLANLAYNRGFSMGNGTMQSIHMTKNADFEYWWTEFRKENGFK